MDKYIRRKEWKNYCIRKHANVWYVENEESDDLLGILCWTYGEALETINNIINHK